MSRYPGPDVRLFAALASAVVWTCAFPPLAWWPLAWIGIAPFLAALRTSPTLGRAVALAWLWCTAFAWCVGAWLPRGVARYFEQPGLVGIAFFLATATLTAGWQYMAFAAVYRMLARRFSVLLPFLAAAAFVGAELARVRGPGADPWGLVGYSQASVPAVIQIADVTGVYGVSFIVLAVNAALAELWIAWRGRRTVRPALSALALAVLLAGTVTAYGWLLLARAGVGPVTTTGTRVCVVQGDVAMHAQWSPSDYGKNLDLYLRLTRDVLARDGASLVVWPESAMTFFLDEEPLYRRAIAGVISPRGAQLLAGSPRALDAAHAAFSNSAFLLGPDGEVLGRYDKQRLLPFAEYFPLSFDALRRRFGRVRQFTAGGPSQPIGTDAGPAGVLICNEAFYGDIAAAHVRAGASWLVNLANDTWVSDAQFSRMALDMVRFRAIEERRWVVRASTWGPSALIDPSGRATVATATDTQEAIGGAIQSLGGETVYARVGDAFAFACVVAAALGLVRRANPRDPPVAGRLTTRV
jgi:apolipoprotein N-acyltransferase